MENFAVPDERKFERLVEKLASRLKERGWNIATAESCTGGWIAKCCTDLAGSSAWFERGFVSYSNRAKQELLGVNGSSLEQAGAVSRAVAIEMAQGARQRAGVHAALAVTGVAGPDGGTPDKPVGTVWFAWSLEGRAVHSEVMQFRGDRDAVRRQTVAHALVGLVELMASGGTRYQVTETEPG